MKTIRPGPIDDALLDPPRGYSVLPFWFWNDRLDADKIRRQIADFENHGVYGFVLHPRVGLPRDCGWMSEALLGFMRVAIEEAATREMTVLLYDEGMYPSGSSSGQVVAVNPDHACRALALTGSVDELPADSRVLYSFEFAGRPQHVVERPVDSFIRGLHYIDDGPAEDEPPAADILNPDAVASFIALVYDHYAQAFDSHFGKTIAGIFTDEPHPLGRCREKCVWPATRDTLHHVNRLLGEDFTEHLPALWIDGWPDAAHHRGRYQHAIDRRLEESWYAPLSDWCADHGVSLCGHPADGDDIGSLRYFHVPGQDVVWRWVQPDHASATQGPESTQAKASSSSKLHLGRSRNSNECCGAFGPQTTFDEVRWVANWLFVRGVDLLIPHAFYYSVRGPRADERPPQLGPHAPWWDRFKPFADACRRLSWLNATATHLCDVAVLTGDRCPWRAAKDLYENQIDFNYLEARLLTEGLAAADADGVRVGPMCYRVLVVEDESVLDDATRAALEPMARAGRVVKHGPDMLAAARRFSELPPILADAPPGVRVRRMQLGGDEYALVFNEAGGPADGMSVSPDKPCAVDRLDPATCRALRLPETPGIAGGPPQTALSLGRHEPALLRFSSP